MHSLPAVHDAQAAPPAPHAPLAVPGWHAPLPSQQPLGQVDALHWHAPLTHSVPVPHATQTAPPAPHCALVVPSTHAVPAQQPTGQSVGPQYARHA